METSIKKQPKLIKDLGMFYANKTSKRKYRYGMYECPKCFKHYRTMIHLVKSGLSSGCSSCGNTKHGGRYTAHYRKWNKMKERCLDKKHKFFNNYGGRGIAIYEPWINDFPAYKSYILSLPDAEKYGYTIDRVKNDFGYFPMNLRWVNKSTQARNTRKLMSTNTSGYRGVHRNSANKKWVARIGIDGKGIHIGSFKTAKEAGIAYDKYVIDNRLEHTTNNIAAATQW